MTTAFTHVRELAELPDGTDLHVRVGRNTPIALQVREGVIYKGNRVIDPWFLEGHVAEGTIMLADLRPLETREWVSQISSDRYEYLLCRRQGDNFRVVYFRDGRRQGSGDIPVGQSVFDSYQRIPRPDWATNPVIELAIDLEQFEAQLASHRRQVDRQRNARNYLRHATDYLAEATRMMAEDQ